MSLESVGILATAWRYPVKSMLGEELNASRITVHGLLGDRAVALMDTETGKIVSAKNPTKWPDLFSFRAAYAGKPLEESLPSIVVTLPDGRRLNSDEPDIDQQLSTALGRSVTLTQTSPQKASLEQYWPEHAGTEQDVTAEVIAGDAPAGAFFDYSTIHLLTTATINQLHESYPQGRFEVRRFRPNLVVDTGAARGFVENHWVGKVLCLGEQVRLQITDPCPRCVMTTLAQGDLPKDPEIYRRGIMHNNVPVPFAGKSLPSVGVYARVIAAGTVCRGDTVRLG
jgi:hypothetical protein